MDAARRLHRSLATDSAIDAGPRHSSHRRSARAACRIRGLDDVRRPLSAGGQALDRQRRLRHRSRPFPHHPLGLRIPLRTARHRGPPRLRRIAGDGVSQRRCALRARRVGGQPRRCGIRRDPVSDRSRATAGTAVLQAGRLSHARPQRPSRRSWRARLEPPRDQPVERRLVRDVRSHENRGVRSDGGRCERRAALRGVAACLAVDGRRRERRAQRNERVDPHHRDSRRHRLRCTALRRGRVVSPDRQLPDQPPRRFVAAERPRRQRRIHRQRLGGTAAPRAVTRSHLPRHARARARAAAAWNHGAHAGRSFARSARQRRAHQPRLHRGRHSQPHAEARTERDRRSLQLGRHAQSAPFPRHRRPQRRRVLDAGVDAGHYLVHAPAAGVDRHLRVVLALADEHRVALRRRLRGRSGSAPPFRWTAAISAARRDDRRPRLSRSGAARRCRSNHHAARRHRDHAR